MAIRYCGTFLLSLFFVSCSWAGEPVNMLLHENARHHITMNYPAGWQIVEKDYGKDQPGYRDYLYLMFCREVSYPQGLYPTPSSPAIMLSKYSFETDEKPSIQEQSDGWADNLKQAVTLKKLEKNDFVTNKEYKGILSRAVYQDYNDIEKVSLFIIFSQEGTQVTIEFTASAAEIDVF